MADWYAFEELESAYDRTKELLLPFDRGTWIRLLILVIFTGAGFNLPTGSWAPDSSSEDYSQTGDSINTNLHHLSSQPITGLATGAGAAPRIALVALFLVSIVAFWSLISSIMSLVYYQSLLDNNVRIRKNFKKNFSKGISYFGFQLTVILSLILVIALPILILSSAPIIGALLLLPALFVLAAGLITLGLTDNFVLPRMIEADEKVVAAWKALYPDLKDEWKQVGAYVFIRFALKILSGMVTMFWAIFTLLAAVIVFGLIALPLYFINPVLVVIPVLIGVIVWLLATVLIQVPIQTYLKYYAILVYHDLTS